MGDWKLLEFLDDNRLELYNLNNDPGEKNNLTGTRPEKTEELRKKLYDWREDVHAQMPQKR
jgi:hypothetical protein